MFIYFSSRFTGRFFDIYPHFPTSSPTRMLCLTCSVSLALSLLLCLSCSVSLAPSLLLCVCLHLIKFCRFLSVIVIVAFFAHSPSLCSSSLSLSRFYTSRRCAITLITFIKPHFFIEIHLMSVLLFKYLWFIQLQINV